jgi:hypothetical protein
VAAPRADRSLEGRPVGFGAFLALAVISFGGPLALAALIAPGLVEDASASAGLAMIAAAVVFLLPLAVWLRYSQRVHTAGGLFGFVEAAAGRPVALAQAAIWILSYVLYLVYTTIQIAYDLLPAVLPGEARYRAALAIAIPVGLAAVMIAGRTAALALAGVLAVGQLALAGALDGITLAHVATPASSFGASAAHGSLAAATARTSLLYVCGSLPLYLGGELRRPARTITSGLLSAWGATALVVVLAVAPLAAAPGLLRTEVPGFSVAQQFASPTFATVLGVGIAASVGGVMLAEYLALGRLLHAVRGWGVRPTNVAVGALIVAAAPLMLIDPHGISEALEKPSLGALWVSQLIVFLVFPRYARKQRIAAQPLWWAVCLAASAFAVYGFWSTVIDHAAS